MEMDPLEDLMRDLLSLAEHAAATRDLLTALMSHLRAEQPALCGSLAATLANALQRDDLRVSEAFVLQAQAAIQALTGSGGGPVALSISVLAPRPSDPAKARASFRLIPGGPASG
ncbi:MAG: hypothetical protein IIA02_10655 [Proteobacteria bacterium]|nr:hypothetical protein [Pseudomonadota bacterium]